MPDILALVADIHVCTYSICIYIYYVITCWIHTYMDADSGMGTPLPSTFPEGCEWESYISLVSNDRCAARVSSQMCKAKKVPSLKSRGSLQYCLP